MFADVLFSNLLHPTEQYTLYTVHNTILLWPNFFSSLSWSQNGPNIEWGQDCKFFLKISNAKVSQWLAFLTGEVFAQILCNPVSREKTYLFYDTSPPSSRKVKIILSSLHWGIIFIHVKWSPWTLRPTWNMVYFYLIVPFKKIVFNAINILNYLHILEHRQRCITVVGKPSKRD